jgi:hypothetical protein
MATVVAPFETATPAPVKQSPLNMTPAAIAKVREIMATQDPIPAGLMFRFPVLDGL